MRDLLEVMAYLLFIIAVFILTVALLGYSYCNDYGEKTGREVNNEFFGGCYVKKDNEWYTRSEFKVLLGK